MENKYDNIADNEEIACEPLGDYGALAVDDEVTTVPRELPSDILGKAIEIALIAEQRGDLIPADEVFDKIFRARGWK